MNVCFVFMKIRASAWLAGKLRGACGNFDAETEKEFQTPTGYIAKDAMSFVQSWVADSTSKYGGKPTLRGYFL